MTHTHACTHYCATVKVSNIKVQHNCLTLVQMLTFSKHPPVTVVLDLLLCEMGMFNFCCAPVRVVWSHTSTTSQHILSNGQDGVYVWGPDSQLFLLFMGL